MALSTQALLEKLRTEVENNLHNEQFGVEELAASVGMSRSNLHRKLQDATGQSVSQFIREYRLGKAMDILKEEEVSSSEVAYRVGFGSATYFSKSFTDYFGYPPGEAKKRSNDVAVEESDPVIRSNNWRPIAFGFVGVIILITLGVFYYTPENDRASTSAVKSESLKSIAVLPFENLSDDQSNKYFADGVMESILNHLTKFDDIRVISRTSMETFRNTNLTIPQIADQLNVTHVLEGSVQKSDNKVRITAQLIDAENDAHLWSENYDREFNDIFTLQSQLAEKIAFELKAKLNPAQKRSIVVIPTTNQTAYDYYLQGVAFRREFKNIEAQDSYTKAIELDSSFALALLRRAGIYRVRFWASGQRTDSLAVLAENDLSKAKILQPNLPELLIEEGMQHYHLQRDYQTAIQKLNEAKRLMPGDPEVYNSLQFVYRRMGLFEEAVAAAEKALELDPLSSRNLSEAASTFSYSQRYQETLLFLEQMKDINPDLGLPTVPFDVLRFWHHLKWKGDVKSAIDYTNVDSNAPFVSFMIRDYERGLETMSSREYELIRNSSWFIPKTAFQALFAYMQNDYSSAKAYAKESILRLEEELLASPDDHRIYSALGLSHAINGDREKAIGLAQKATQLMPTNLDAIQGDWREFDLLLVYAILKENDLVLDQVEKLLNTHVHFSLGVLETLPLFDELRNSSRYNEIITNPQFQVKGN